CTSAASAYRKGNGKNCWVGKTAFEGLDPLAGKLARAVLRGLGTGNSLWLLGNKGDAIKSISSRDQPKIKFNGKTLLQDFKSSILGDERQQLQLELDSGVQEDLEKYKREANRNLVLSAGATSMALMATFSPLFTLLGIAGIFYLARDIFGLVWHDMKRGHYFSVYLLSLVLLVGMIASGHLVLAAFSGLMGGIMMKIIKKAEDNSQKHLLDVFSGHPSKVWVEKDDVEIQIDFNDLKKDDIVIVNAWEVIPVDGVIKSGLATIDQHLLTGESQPVEREDGDTVFASTLLLSGRVSIIVETAGEDTLAAGIGHLLNNTQHYKDNMMARGQKLADSFLPWELGIGGLTLFTLGPSAALAALWSGFGANMAILGPLSVLNYLQILSRQGILIKDGRVFESMRQVDTVVFDKTGTLTMEQPTVGMIHTFMGFDENEVMRFAAAAEHRQNHPVAKAIVSKADELELILPEMDDASYALGFGIQVTIEERLVQVGSLRFMQQKEVELPDDILPLQQLAEQQGYSLIYLAIDQQLAGMLEMHPTIRPEAQEVLHYLKQRGLTLYIISGDHEEPTRHMAEKLGIHHYFSEVLPENKADMVQKLRDKGKFVCFVGDGINDAVALKSAQVSISLKGASSAATDTAQIIFMEQSLRRLPTIFDLSDEFEQTMNNNLVGSVMPGIVNIAGIYLLHTGIALGMTIFYLGSLVGLGNTLMPLAKHQDKKVE
ncbi:MAG: heavy metal translocating P-type ATPase, partial [Mariprofundaceae bacterium]|nr:heavy metal translocating P-type ATPase [Mariprofundaceae bacterium]